MKRSDTHTAGSFIRASADEVVYRSLFESSPGLFVVLDPNDYCIMAVSDNYLTMIGCDREDLVGRIFPEAFPDDPDNPEASGTANLLASLQRVKTTLTKDVMGVQKHPIVNRKTGILEDRFWTPMHSPVLGADGSLSLIIHRTEDVTDFVRNVNQAALDAVTSGEVNILIQARELKLLNEQLLDSQQRLQAIFRHASLGIAASDLDGCLTDANAAYCDMLGYSLAELKGRDILELTHPDDRVNNKKYGNELIMGKRAALVYEKRYIAASGNILWSRISASPLRNTEGTITNLMAIAEDITAQKEAEAELKQIRALERIGGSIARVGGWVSEPRNGEHHVYWSHEVFDVFEYHGASPPSLQEVLDRLQPVSRILLERALGDAWHGVSFDIEISLASFMDNEKWLRIAGEPERDAQGAVIRILGAVQDITRQKEEQVRGQKLGNQLFSTLESMRDAFYLLDRDWRFMYLNSEAERILGTSREVALGQVIWDNNPLFKASVAYPLFQHAFRTGEPQHAEYHAPMLKNWINLSAYPSNEGLAVYFRTTTAEKQLLTQLAESEKRLKHVTQAALDVAWEIDMLDLVVWVNDGLKRFGYAEEFQSLKRSYWVDKIHPEDRSRVVSAMAKLVASNRNEWSIRYRFRHAGGGYVHLDDRGFIFRDAEGKALSMVGGSTDITRRVELEEQVLQSQRLESVGQLTGGIAHDFNNLLTVILGNAQLLHEQLEESNPLRELTEIINIAATRGANLTRHLLAFSRKQALQPQTLDINELLVSLKDMLTRTLGNNIIINNNTSRGLWPAYIDPNHLEVALLNLCINSRDAMPHGGIVTLETSNIHLDQVYSLTHSDVDPGDYVVICVSDTGTGIAPDIIDRVFEPFFTTKDAGKGTGLGLSTVFGFIKQSSGHVSLSSEVGQGTTIRIFLPRSHEHVEAQEAAVPADHIQGGKELVLLVEDNELVRKFGHDQMLSLGYQVIEACDASSALAILHQRRDIELLFTDVVMPGMSGHELARQALLLRPGLKVLFTSGYTRDSIIQNGKLERGVMLLEKPYGKASLAAKVREALNGTPLRENAHER